MFVPNAVRDPLVTNSLSPTPQTRIQLKRFSEGRDSSLRSEFHKSEGEVPPLYSFIFGCSLGFGGGIFFCPEQSEGTLFKPQVRPTPRRRMLNNYKPEGPFQSRACLEMTKINVWEKAIPESPSVPAAPALNGLCWPQAPKREDCSASSWSQRGAPAAHRQS